MFDFTRENQILRENVKVCHVDVIAKNTPKIFIKAILIDITVCENGYYGNNCSQHCGNCLNGGFCDKLTGFCGNGCKPHFKRPLCQGNVIQNWLYTTI